MTHRFEPACVARRMHGRVSVRGPPRPGFALGEQRCSERTRPVGACAAGRHLGTISAAGRPNGWGFMSMYAIREQYLRAWEHVLAVADAVDRSAWSAPSPCAGWTAGHVAGHLIDVAHQTFALLAGAPPVLPTSEPTALRGLAAEVPAGRLREAVDPLIARVRDLDAQTLVATPHGDLPAPRFLTIALVEPVVHGWDLAVAVKAPVRLDDDAVASLLTAAQAMDGQLAASGMYAPALPSPVAAEPQERLLALLGRRAGPG